MADKTFEELESAAQAEIDTMPSRLEELLSTNIGQQVVRPTQVNEIGGRIDGLYELNRALNQELERQANPFVAPTQLTIDPELFRLVGLIETYGKDNTPASRAHSLRTYLENPMLRPGGIPGVNPISDKVFELRESLERAKQKAEVAFEAAKKALAIVEDM